MKSTSSATRALKALGAIQHTNAQQSSLSISNLNQYDTKMNKRRITKTSININSGSSRTSLNNSNNIIRNVDLNAYTDKDSLSYRLTNV